MSNKANLTALLAETGGSARHRSQPPSGNRPSPPTQPRRKRRGRAGTAPITVHFPKQVRDQLKILAVQNDTTLHSLSPKPSTICSRSTASPRSHRRRRLLKKHRNWPRSAGEASNRKCVHPR